MVIVVCGSITIVCVTVFMVAGTLMLLREMWKEWRS